MISSFSVKSKSQSANRLCVSISEKSVSFLRRLRMSGKAAGQKFNASAYVNALIEKQIHRRKR